MMKIATTFTVRLLTDAVGSVPGQCSHVRVTFLQNATSTMVFDDVISLFIYLFIYLFMRPSPIVKTIMRNQRNFTTADKY